MCFLINYETERKERNFLNMLVWCVQLILFVFFTTEDLIIFFSMFELSLVPIFIMILKWGSATRRALASYYFFLFTSAGAILMLVGIFLLIMSTNTTNFILLELYHFSEVKQIIMFFFFF